MAFPFDINQLFPERVTLLDQTLVAENRKSTERPDLLAHIVTVIDELGRASAKAQQLTTPITSASKLQSQKHQLYLLKDVESNRGHGMVVGFLKVGYKKLFLLDRQGVHIEAEPLCVLDFYIAENFQRHGYGSELFDFMLQVNNFVVFEGFFLNKTVAQLRKVPLKKPDGEIKPYSVMEREVVNQEQRALPWPFPLPHSPQRSVSSQSSNSLSVGSSPSRVPLQVTSASAVAGNRDNSPQSPLTEHCRARRTSQQGLAARCSLYHWHLDTRAVGLLDRHTHASHHHQDPPSRSDATIVHNHDPLPPSGSTISCHLDRGPPPLSDANKIQDPQLLSRSASTMQGPPI
ncbi:alpha-tubulin N-acetyltransferase 1 isoform X2 [Hippoglossus stenolepis]|uniref:alpha-tubulin N-acetyltransferase 1 isoform X2 n=1 Tax=Hippoglossus stenolepis TaxID=195615 RepID=UPI00159C213E|nr:alpha-tubulin N-acetyltransferase 1 isoform X2 [Hippoglossus stenolepis]